jgi:hypothetical protein
VIRPEKVQGFCGAFGPVRPGGRPWGKIKNACVQTQRVPDEEHTLTGWLSVTTVANEYTWPAAQLGLQSSSL